MQTELAGENPDTKIRILGINFSGSEFANEYVVDGRTLPWLQDTNEVNAWALWEAAARDVIILDVENKWYGEYNLAANPLEDATNYAELKSILKTAAGE